MSGTRSAVPTVSTGDWITSGWVNTYIGGNEAAHWNYTTAGDLQYATSATTLTRLAIGSAGQKLVSSGSAPVWIDDDFDLAIVLGNGVTVIATGAKGAVPVPVDCTVEGWTIVAPLQSGSIVVDIWKDTYANFPPTVADTIAGSEKPTISSAQKGQDLSLGSWTTALTKGDFLIPKVDSCSTITLATLVLHCRKTAVA